MKEMYSALVCQKCGRVLKERDVAWKLKDNQLCHCGGDMLRVEVLPADKKQEVVERCMTELFRDLLGDTLDREKLKEKLPDFVKEIL